MNQTWRQKLTSRKFWAAIIGFTTAMLTALNYKTLEIEQVASIISASSILIAYIVGEGLVDAAAAKAPIIIEAIDEDEEDITL